MITSGNIDSYIILIMPPIIGYLFSIDVRYVLLDKLWVICMGEFPYMAKAHIEIHLGIISLNYRNVISEKGD